MLGSGIGVSTERDALNARPELVRSRLCALLPRLSSPDPAQQETSSLVIGGRNSRYRGLRTPLRSGART